MKIRVLIVDDEKEFANALGERLKVRNFDVTVSFSGDDCIEKVKAYNYDVVILDVVMPGTDGIETLHEIKKLKPLTEVIMLSGHATVETAIEGMKVGAFDYLLKPCETEDMVAKIKKAHDRKTEHDERIREAKVKKIIDSPMSILEDES